MDTKVTVIALRRMKREGRKIVGVVAWDFQIAQIADRAGVDLVSVGDSVGVNLWGRAANAPVTVDEMLVCCRAVRAGAKRALVSCDVPAGTDALRAAVRLAEEGGADMVKVLGDAQTVRAIVKAGVSVFAEIHGDNMAVATLVQLAGQLEDA